MLNAGLIMPDYSERESLILSGSKLGDYLLPCVDNRCVNGNRNGNYYLKQRSHYTLDISNSFKWFWRNQRVCCLPKSAGDFLDEFEE